MDRDLLEKAAYSIILFVISPLILMYFSKLDTIALWLYAWLIPFCSIIFYKKIDLFIKGLLIIAYTVLMGAVGSLVIVKAHPNVKEIVENLAIMLTLLAGGIGGNFMSHELIKNSRQEVKKIARITGKADQAGKLKAALALLEIETRKEPGCVEFRFFQSLSNELDFILLEHFISSSAFQDHMKFAHTQDFFSAQLFESVKAAVDIPLEA